tara:strand:+ start:433 stop:639 length:207 start_codon:yes stop_codon:yes gene_type:complete
MSNKTVKVSLTLNQIKCIEQAFIDMDGNKSNFDSDEEQFHYYPRWMQDAQYSVRQKLVKAEKELGENK